MSVLFGVLLLGALSAPLNAEPVLPGKAPYTLEQTIDLALQRNPDLLIANERIAQAEAQVGESLAAFYPQVKARLSYQYSDNPAQAFGMIVAQRRYSPQQDINHPIGTTDFRPEVIASLSLFRGGQDYQRHKLAELGKEISELQRSSIRNNLVHAVTEGFYALLVAQENQQVAQRAEDTVAAQLRSTETRYHGGTVLKSDVLSLQVRLAAAQEARIRAHNAIALAQTVLRTLIDLEPDSPLDVVPGSAETNPSITLNDLLQQAAARRSEMQAAQKQVEAKQRELKMAEGAHLPRVDAFVSYGLNERSPEFNGGQDNVTAGVALEMDIFNGFGTQQKISGAARQLTEAQQAQRKTQLQINQEVHTAYLELQQAQQRQMVTDAATDAAEEALRLVGEQRREGVATVTRFIEAESARDQALAQAIAARYDVLRADAALKRAVGEWQ